MRNWSNKRETPNILIEVVHREGTDVSATAPQRLSHQESGFYKRVNINASDPLKMTKFDEIPGDLHLQ